MQVILLSGGSGQRLWPLSNDSRSKQFLKVLEGHERINESMSQRVWRQIDEVGLMKSAVIATSKKQVDILKNQLGSNVPLIIEPERRDTFPAIALAASYLYSFKGISPDEVVSVLPIDSYVENDFYESVKKLEDTLNTTDCSIALMGVEPSYPSTSFGYIVPEKKNDGLVHVSHFVEKPTEEYAQSLIKEEALWNCGVFAFKLGFMISILEEMNLPLEYEELQNVYELLPSISFDFEVVEKTKNIVALPYKGIWRDLGIWSTLTEQMMETVQGLGVICPKSHNTHIINELDIPVAVLGMPDAVVVASPDGILVANKGLSHDLKKFIFHFNQRPMYEERRWGSYKVLDHTVYDNGTEVLTKRITIHAGSNLSYQEHNKRKEVWTILKGEGSLVLNEYIYDVKPGSVIEIPAGTRHALKAISDLELIEVQKGSSLTEEDVYRISMEWDEILPMISSVTL